MSVPVVKSLQNCIHLTMKRLEMTEKHHRMTADEFRKLLFALSGEPLDKEFSIQIYFKAGVFAGLVTRGSQIVIHLSADNLSGAERLSPWFFRGSRKKSYQLKINWMRGGSELKKASDKWMSPKFDSALIDMFTNKTSQLERSIFSTPFRIFPSTNRKMKINWFHPPPF